VVARTNRKKPKAFLHRGVENTEGTENSGEPTNGK
jgi:hypothetical protein